MQQVRLGKFLCCGPISERIVYRYMSIGPFVACELARSEGKSDGTISALSFPSAVGPHVLLEKGTELVSWYCSTKSFRF
jgi:hypothetical protein